MQNSFEEIFSRIRTRSYQNNDSLPHYLNPSNQVLSYNKALMAKSFQVNSKKRLLTQSSPMRSRNEPQNMFIKSHNHTLDEIQISLVKLCLSDSQEVYHQKTSEELLSKLQTSKLQPCATITLEDLTINRKILCEADQQQKNVNSILTEVMDDKALKSKFQKKEKVVMKLTTQEGSLQVFSPKRLSSHDRHNSKTSTTSPIKDINFRRDPRNSNKGSFSGLSNFSSITKSKERVETEESDKRVPILEKDKNRKEAILNDNKRIERTSLQAAKKDVQPLVEYPSENSFSAIRGKGINNLKQRENHHKPKESATEKLYSLIDSYKRPDERQSCKKKIKQDFYRQIATEDERERMSTFLKDEYVNELLLNRYHKNLDKFQIRDVLNETQQKFDQDKDTRYQFIQMLKTGIRGHSLPIKQEVKPKEGPKISPNLATRSSVRKQTGLSFLEFSNNNLTKKSEEDDKVDSQNKDYEQLKGSKLKRIILNKVLENKTQVKRGSQDFTTIKSAKSDDGEDDVDLPKLPELGDRTHSQQIREMDRIRLLTVNKTLNNKLNKTVNKSEISEIPEYDSLIKAINPIDTDKTFIFFKASQEGDYKTLIDCLEKNRNFVFEFDSSRQTALHLAVKEGHIETCRLLLQYGANTNAKDLQDRTPIYYALKAKRMAIIKLLLSLERKGSPVQRK